MKRFISLLLICTLTTSVCMAASPSTWAQDEVMEAVSLGFVPEDLQDDYQNPISRVDFARLAVNYVAFQYGYRHMDGTYRAGTVMQFFEDYCQNHAAPNGSPYEIIDYFPGVDEEDIPSDWVHIFNGPVEYHPFTDFNQYEDGRAYTQEEVAALNYDPMYAGIAQILGIVNGRTETTFDPYGAITRQEAAAMLSRTYRVYDGTPSAATATTVSYTDYGEIADWARESVALVSNLGVMNGVEGGRFNPAGTYTIEQCISTFVRLYETAPVSAKLGNITPLRSYEETWESIVDNMGDASLTVLYEEETPTYKVVCGAAGNGTIGWGNPYFVYVLLPAGGYYQIKDLPYLTVREFSLDQETNLLTVYGVSGNDTRTYTIDILAGTVIEN